MATAMSKPIRVISYGLGAIGRAAAELVLQKFNMQLVGAVDLNPQAVGRDFGDVTPLRGVVLGGGRHDLEVAVDVLPDV